VVPYISDYSLHKEAMAEGEGTERAEKEVVDGLETGTIATKLTIPINF